MEVAQETICTSRCDTSGLESQRPAGAAIGSASTKVSARQAVAGFRPEAYRVSVLTCLSELWGIDVSDDSVPKRIQRKRIKGWRMPDCAIYVGRPTRWGNPFNATQTYMAFAHRGFPVPLVRLRTKPSLDRCLDMYVGWLAAQLAIDADFLAPLKDKDLCCWCRLDQPCHADILIRLANYW